MRSQHISAHVMFWNVYVCAGQLVPLRFLLPSGSTLIIAGKHYVTEVLFVFIPKRHCRRHVKSD